MNARLAAANAQPAAANVEHATGPGTDLVTHHAVVRNPLRVVLFVWLASTAAVIASGIVWSVRNGGGDWRVFVAAGSLGGSRALLDPPEAWQSFFYLPAAAWALAPLAHLSLAVSFAANAVLMLACAAGAGVLAARTYALPRGTAVAMFALWSPVVYAAAIIGQNAPLGLLLAQLSIAGMATRSVLLTAVPIGLLLYKPTYAAPLVALLLLRGRLRELMVVVAIGAAWYVLGVPATGGDWGWPAAWLRLLAHYASGDLAVNGGFAISLPALLVHVGLGVPLAATAAALGAAAAAFALRRTTAVEAGSAACLVGLALSPHAWAYDAALALPMIGFTAAALAEPNRTRFLLGIAIAAPLFFVSPLLRFDPLAIVVVGGTFVWLAHAAGRHRTVEMGVSERRRPGMRLRQALEIRR